MVAGGETADLEVVKREHDGFAQAYRDAGVEDAVVGRLRAAGRTGGSELLTTLETYLAHGGSAADAAAELFVHRNTLRKRLTRIE